MTQQQRIAQAQQQQQQQQEAAAAAAGGGAGGSSSSTHAQPTQDAQAQAVAFKDRLVEYDRHSQKRTTVIDDQSDFFEIETNAWLSEEVGEDGRCVLGEEGGMCGEGRVCGCGYLGTPMHPPAIAQLLAENGGSTSMLPA